MSFRIFVVAILLAVASAARCATLQVRLHALDGGRATAQDCGFPSDTGLGDRSVRIAKNTYGRIVVQHDLRDFARLPRFPAYLD